MSFAKFMRKNYRILMAVLLGVIMVAFVGGSALTSLLSSNGPSKKTIATYGDNQKISEIDFIVARNELQVLRALRADMITGDNITSAAIASLIFDRGKYEGQFSAYIKRQLQDPKNMSKITPEDVDTFFDDKDMQSEYYWILLNKETNDAGIAVSRAEVANFFQTAIPQLPAIYGEGATAEAVLRKISNDTGLTQDSLLSVFARYMAIGQYAQTIARNENVTINQLKSTAAYNGEKYNADLVKLSATSFTDRVPAPTDEELTAQLNKFASVTPGTISDDNPMGFGYKVPKRAKLEYIYIELDDMEPLITMPTPDESEEFYRQNLERFTTEEKINPEDENSETKSVTKPYIQVASQIRESLIQERKNSQADKIINEIKQQLEEKIALENTEDFTSADYKANLIDFKTVTDKVSKNNNNIKITTGTTGLLDYNSLERDRVLGRLMAIASTYVPLPKIVFSIEQLGTKKLSKFETKTPKMYQNIGPLRSQAGAFAITRVIEVADEKIPSSIDFAYDATEASLEVPVAKTVAVKDALTADVKKLKAFQLAKENADKLLEMLKTDDLETALKNLNTELNKDLAEGTKKITLTAENWEKETRTEPSQLNQYKQMIKSQPYFKSFVDSMISKNNTINKAMNLIPEGQTTATNLPVAIESEIEAGVYVINSLSVERATTKDLDNNRIQNAIAMGNINDSYAFIEFNPKNIVARNNFKITETKSQED